ncbi:hypothetical protein AJ79_03592 [Helicocarpus griseus UAMH5409]|uniref:Uncharacterized protein n=1 Tax=Helicocarpus griseus UAMH5409 TaxID=1447875 RepID=A0A2B7XXE0_9EURO|nr:hypothetical protein AJ79_03592 [Helicocarpus griseus UAMH5409]
MSASKPSEADIVFNRANVALARSQRLIASWLPPKTPEEIASAKTEEDLQREEDEIFTPVPEKLGLGAPLPKSQADGSFNRTELSSNEKLRKQLLGKNYKKPTANAAPNSSNARPGVAEKKYQPARPASKQQPESDDDEDEGRSSLGRNKRKRSKSATVGTGNDKTTTTTTAAVNDNGNGHDDDDDEDGSKFGGKKQRSMKTQRKKPVSYLDELLSERSKKKKKKQ